MVSFYPGDVSFSPQFLPLDLRRLMVQLPEAFLIVSYLPIVDNHLWRMLIVIQRPYGRGTKQGFILYKKLDDADEGQAKQLFQFGFNRQRTVTVEMFKRHPFDLKMPIPGSEPVQQGQFYFTPPAPRFHAIPPGPCG